MSSQCMYIQIIYLLLYSTEAFQNQEKDFKEACLYIGAHRLVIGHLQARAYALSYGERKKSKSSIISLFMIVVLFCLEIIQVRIVTPE